jgi:hypothetical protein
MWRDGGTASLQIVTEHQSKQILHQSTSPLYYGTFCNLTCSISMVAALNWGYMKRHKGAHDTYFTHTLLNICWRLLKKVVTISFLTTSYLHGIKSFFKMNKSLYLVFIMHDNMKPEKKLCGHWKERYEVPIWVQRVGEVLLWNKGYVKFFSETKEYMKFYCETLEQWFSNCAPQEVARCAMIMKVYFRKEKKPISIEICIHSLKYINIFLILYTKCTRKCLFYSAPQTKKVWEPLP